MSPRYGGCDNEWSEEFPTICIICEVTHCDTSLCQIDTHFIGSHLFTALRMLEALACLRVKNGMYKSDM